MKFQKAKLSIVKTEPYSAKFQKPLPTRCLTPGWMGPEMEVGTVEGAVPCRLSLASGLRSSQGWGVGCPRDDKGGPPQAPPHRPPDSVMVCVPTEPEWCAHHRQPRPNSQPPRQAAPIPGEQSARPDPVCLPWCREPPQGRWS